MKQRWLPWLGGFLLALSQLVPVLFGVEAVVEPRVALQYGVMTLSGLLLLAAGARERYTVVGVTVRWHRLYGGSMALLGLGLCASYLAAALAGGTGTGRTAAAVAAVGSLALVWFGYQIAYATRHVRLEPDPNAGE